MEEDIEKINELLMEARGLTEKHQDKLALSASLAIVNKEYEDGGKDFQNKGVMIGQTSNLVASVASQVVSLAEDDPHIMTSIITTAHQMVAN